MKYRTYSALVLFTFICVSDALENKEGTVCFRLHLKERNVEELKAIVRDISSLTPSGSFAVDRPPHLSHEEIADLIGRTEEEIDDLNTELSKHNGRVEHVGRLRDIIKACFDVHPALRTSTRKMLSIAWTSPKTALSAFSSYLHPSTSRILRAVEPLSLRKTNMATQRKTGKADYSIHHQTRPANSWNFPFPLYLGNEKGQLQAAGVSTPIKAFTEMIVFNNNEIGLYNYGVYSPAKILQRPVLDVGFALALPSNAEINSTNFARKSIPFTFTIYYNLTDDATFKNTQAFSIRINQSHPAVQTIKVGDALTAAKKNAPPEAQQFFPTDLAEQINNEAINRTRMSSDFSDETLLFAVDLSKVGLPTYMGLWGLGVHVSIQLENGNQVMTNGTYFLGNGLSIVDDSGPNFNTPHMNFTSIWPHGTQQAAKPLVVAVAENFQTYAYNPRDLEISNKAFNLSVPDVVEILYEPYFIANTPETCGPVNNLPPQDIMSCTEPALDLQLISRYSSGSGATIAFASPNATIANALPEPYPFLMYMDLQPVPDVLSLSYDGGEDDTDAITDIAILKAAALGITVVTSSGDVGAAAMSNGLCSPGKKLQPQYLASSEWATSVGALQYVRPTENSPTVLSAAMANAGAGITTGGGFSSLFPQPSFQTKFVEKFINYSRNLPSFPKNAKEQYFFPNNRGYPDLSTFGWVAPMMYGLVPSSLAGTSASAPIIAGVVMQLNAAIRATPGLENEKLGYATRFWYWAAENYPNAFTDVVYGGNNFNGRAAVTENCGVGFQATPGWDAATGLGLPNVGILSQAAIQYVKMRQSLQANISGVAVTLGSNQFGQLGSGTAGKPRLTAKELGGSYRGAQWKTSTAGQDHACAILASDSTLRCWGRGTSCQLGTGNCTNQYLPAQLGGKFAVAKWAAVSGGGDFTCALTAQQRQAYCWGSNENNQLAGGVAANQTSSRIPVPMGTPQWASTSWSVVSTGTHHACGIRSSDRQLFCWGSNLQGQLGIGSNVKSSAVPRAVKSPPGTRWNAVSAGGEHTCAIRRGDGALLCWGSNASGQLGTGNTTTTLAFSPVAVSMNYTAASESNTTVSSLPWTEVTCNVMHTCAVLDVKHMYCWGSNADGQLGTGKYTSSSTPQKVRTPPTIIGPLHKPSAGQFSTCALSKYNDLYCWGMAPYGVSTKNGTVPYPYYISGLAPMYTYDEVNLGGGFLIAVHAAKNKNQ